MFNPNKIIELEIKRKINDKKFTVSKLLTFVPLTPPAYRDIKNGVSIPKVTVLERIAIFYEVVMNFFFDIKSKKQESELEHKTSEIIITDANEYMLNRFEEVVRENGELKERLRVYEVNSRESYTLPNVSSFKAAAPELKKADQLHPKKK